MNAERETPLASEPEIEPQKKEFAKLILDIVILLIRLNVEFKTRKFEERFQGISPDHVSFAGFALDLVTDAMLIYFTKIGIKLSPVQKVLFLGIKTIIISSDMFDGALARAKEISGRPHDSRQGLKNDTALDRFGIAINGFTKAFNAYLQHKNLATLMLELGVIIGQLLTDPLPSLANAGQKATGKKDKKEGNSSRIPRRSASRVAFSKGMKGETEFPLHHYLPVILG